MYHRYTVEYYSAIKKERNWVSCTDVDEPTAYYTAWSKSEGEKQISSINTYVWNLEKQYWRTHLQGRDRDADREGTWVTEREGEIRTSWDSSPDIHFHVRSRSLVGSSSAIRGAQPALWLTGREGIYTWLWQIRAVIRQKSTQHSKAIILQLKKNFFSFKRIKSSYVSYNFLGL